MLDTGEDVYADMDLDGRHLNILVNSRQGAEDVIARLSAPLHGLVGEPIIEEEEAGGAGTSLDPSELPEETQQALQQYMRDHYLKVLDEPLPMLNNRTPRDAAKSEAGRREVVEWLKLIENGHAANGDVAYDASWLWDELDLRPHRK